MTHGRPRAAAAAALISKLSAPRRLLERSHGLSRLTQKQFTVAGGVAVVVVVLEVGNLPHLDVLVVAVVMVDLFARLSSLLLC
jgi:hypothetical protein